MEHSQSQDDNKGKGKGKGKGKAISTTVLESEWDEPFTEEDLQAIEAAEASSLSKKRRPVPVLDYADQPQSAARRRLPSSVLALQHPNVAFALSPCRQAANIRMRYPVLNFGGQVKYSRTSVDVEKAAMEILKTESKE